MAKKTRRARPRVPKPPRALRVSRSVQSPTVKAPAKEVDFAEEYHYVVEDLKRIAIIALVLLVLLIVVAIFIS
ncbi:MAG: hypothetical protein PVH17_01945 [Anaerolineae bacterium]|jgi:hypothetical protein